MTARKLLDPSYIYAKRDRILLYLRRLLKGLPRAAHRALNGFGIPVTPNDRRLRALKGIHVGERAFVLGMGPSLRVTDLDRLKGEITFACNKIYLAFDETEWRPTHYSVADIVLAQNNQAEIAQLDLHKIFGSNVRPVFGCSEDVTYMRQIGNPRGSGEPQVMFSKNVLAGVNGGWTILYLQLQLAYYMGIREIYLIGVDFSFDVPEPTGETSELGEEILESTGQEMNHFHPDYREPGEKWTMPKLDYQYLAFESAKEAFHEAGGIIVNASRETELDVFPLGVFDEIVS